MAVANGADPEMKCSTINLQTLAACALFASKEETRYYLQGVCVELDERGATYIATDGARLIACREDLEPDEDDNRLTGTFIIPTPHCKHFKLGVDPHAKMFGAGRLTIAYEFVDVTFLPIDGVFPDWRKSVPIRKPSGEPGQFQLKFLSELQKFAKAMDLGVPFIAHDGPANPALVSFPGHPDVVGILMPMKVAGQLSRELPQWVRRSPERQQADIEDAAIAVVNGLSPEPPVSTADAPFQLPADA